MKINFKEVKVPTSIKKEEFKTEDLREQIADAIYKNTSKVSYMSLALRIYDSKGEIELNEDETTLLSEFCQGLPLYIKDALGLL